MNPSGLLLFLFTNIALLIVSITAIYLVYTYRRNQGSGALLSQLDPTLQMLGFTKKEWQRGVPFRSFELLDGYYHGVAHGKQFEVHIYPAGTRRRWSNPQVEIILLGYFNARLGISTPDWEKTRPYLAWQMPKKLAIPGLDNLSIRTADENSAGFLLDTAASRDPILALLRNQASASVVITPVDIHFTLQVDDPQGITPFVVQNWLKSLAGIAQVAQALPPLPLEARMEFNRLPRKAGPATGRVLLVLILALLLLPAVIAYLMMTR
jgi:hypothetical protein